MILWQIFGSFFKIGLFTFGGGYAMLPMIEREIVSGRRWASREEVIDIFAVSQSLPGVIALNTATQIGYKKRGVAGGVVATLGAAAPSLIIITLIAAALSFVWDNAVLASAFAGIGVAVCALIFSTVLDFLKSSIADTVCLVIFILVFACSFLLTVSPFVYVLAASAVGIGVGHIKKRQKGKKSDKENKTYGEGGRE